MKPRHAPLARRRGLTMLELAIVLAVMVVLATAQHQSVPRRVSTNSGRPRRVAS